MQHKLMVFFATLVLFSLVSMPIGTAQAQDVTSNCPPYEPGLLRDKGFLRSVPPECIGVYRQQGRNPAIQNMQPMVPGEPNSFGYTYDDSAAYNWITATTNSGLTGDDEFTGPIDIGFDFPFYGILQSELYFSTNGLITFGAGAWYWDGPGIPSDQDPNNLIAPFWDDLIVGSPDNSGAIYYSRGGSAPNRYFVIEWRAVETSYSSPAFSFEAILRENGDILFQYQSVPDSFWPIIGLEDDTGYDGLGYYSYNITPLKAIQFDYPAPAARVHVSPASRAGGFAPVGGNKDFTVTISNSGSLGTDTYDLSITAGWTVTFYRSDGVTPLTDTDADSVIDTGPLPQGASVTIIVRFNAPGSAQIGDDTTGIMQIKSSLDVSTLQAILLSVSIPAEFVGVFQDNADGAMSFMTVSSQQTNIHKATADNYSGYGIAVSPLTSGNYLYAWDKGYSNATIGWRNIEFAVVAPNGSIVVPARKLTDNSGASMYTADRFPSLAVLPNGTVGIVWTRYILNSSTNQFNYNIYFVTLDASGNLLTGPANITNNTAWGRYSDQNVPRFRSPTIAASDDNRFVLGWEDEQTGLMGGLVSDLWYAARTATGASVLAPTALTSYGSSTGPILNSLTGGKVIMTWLEVGLGPYYAIIGSNGSVAKTYTSLRSGADYCSYCYSPDAVQLPNGKIAVAWGTLTGVELAILDPSYSIIQGPTQAFNPLHPVSSLGETVSVTTDSSSRVIMTWVGPDNRLLYALGDSAGNFLTDPSIYRVSGAYIAVSGNGQGNAPYRAYTFNDVSAGYWAWNFIERLYKAGITGGCETNPLKYCPEGTVTRAQMAVFLERGIHGSAYNPPAVGSSTGFGDVPPTYWAAAWIKQLAAEGITGGCAAGAYCPEAPVTRAQMAVFLLRSKHGASYNPPGVGAGTGFGDVPSNYWAAAWIKQLVAEGITSGCGTGTYCPEAPVTRAQMAVFLVKTFNLP